MSNALNEDGYEHQCINWLKGINWDWKYGPSNRGDCESIPSHDNASMIP